MNMKRRASVGQKSMKCQIKEIKKQGMDRNTIMKRGNNRKNRKW